MGNIIKCVYLPHTLSSGDFGIGPSKFARRDGAEGDPHSMNMNSYRRDFLETREEVSRKLNLPTTDPHVRAQARFIVRHEHYEPDLRASQTENSGIIDYEAEREFAVINGQATYLNSDGSPSKFTFSNFHERTLGDENESVRDQYSEEAHKADLLLQSAIVNATGIVEVTKFAHDARGVRDAYTFTYDPVINRGKIRIKNMAPDGKFLNPQEARERMHELFKDRKEIKTDESVFILTNTDEKADVRIFSTYNHYVDEKIGVSQKAETPGRSVPDVKQVKDRVYENLVEETKETERFSGETVIRQLFQEPEKEAALNVLSGEGLEREMEGRTEYELTDLWLIKAQETLLITPEQSEALLKEVEETYRIMSDAQKIITIVDNTRIGIAGALFALETMTLADPIDQTDASLANIETTWIVTQEAQEIFAIIHETGEGVGAVSYYITMLTYEHEKEMPVDREKPINLLEDITEHWRESEERKVSIVLAGVAEISFGALYIFDQMIEESTGQYDDFFVNESFAWITSADEKSPDVTDEEKDQIFSLFTDKQEKHTASDEETKFENTPQDIDVQVLRATIDFVRSINTKPIKEQEAVIKAEKNRVGIHIIQIWEVMIDVFGQDEEKKESSAATVHKPGEPVRLTREKSEDRQSLKEHEERSVGEFSFAFTAWFMLKLITYYSALDTLEGFIKQGSQTPELLVRIRKDKPEGLIQKEPAQWLLFAIIWYLAMIREQGMYTNTPAPNQQKKKRKEVIIYAYAS